MQGTTGVVWRKQKPEADRGKSGTVPLLKKKKEKPYGLFWGLIRQLEHRSRIA
jgi:hypothetical protein